MELASPVTNIRAQVCIVMRGYPSDIARTVPWTPAAEDFLRRLHKLGVTIAIIGPKPARKFGSKRTITFLDRHFVVGLKNLTSSKSHQHELRLLNQKSKAWSRLRCEIVLTVGQDGIWPVPFEGWTLPGILTVDSMYRWVNQYQWLPGREIAFLGSSNQVLRLACLALDKGAKHCYVIEQASEYKCWRAYHDRFISKGGRILTSHQIVRAQGTETGPVGIRELYLKNEQGTLILPVDTMVISCHSDHSLNSPQYWKNGLFYLQRRMGPWEGKEGVGACDEEQWFEDLDWRELYWRITRYLEITDHSEAEGGIKKIKLQRKEMAEYRRVKNGKFELKYSGKILERETLSAIQSSPSVPRSFADSKRPVASLECFENIACRACADSCPENAISIPYITMQPELSADACTGCGACVAACPSSAAVMIKENVNEQKARYFFSDDSTELWKQGQLVQMLSRKGDVLGTGRVQGAAVSYEGGRHRVLEIESTNVHLWDARSFRVIRDEFFNSAPTVLKRGWVTLNGVKRLCPTDVPLLVAFWQMGIKRFGDAFFCGDESCRMCEAVVDGKRTLACKSIVQEGQSIEVGLQTSVDRGLVVCPCSKVEKSSFENLQQELTGQDVQAILRDMTGIGQGKCHGRWCMHSEAVCRSNQGEGKLRPNFNGYEASPWRDLDLGDLIVVPEVEEPLGDETEDASDF